MASTFVAYIDESGDEGFKFDKGSSEWFVLSAVITRKAVDLATVKLVDSVRMKLGKPAKKPLHFRDLKHEQRLPFVDEISKADLRIISIMVHKPTLNEQEKFMERYRLYFYAARYLFERISWYCRDHRTRKDTGDGSCNIVFSNRSGMSYEDLRNYFQALKDSTGLFKVRIEWSVIKPEQITAYTPIKRMGLLIADAVASSFFYATQRSQYGYTEDRYARILKPIVYHRQGRYMGYGLKFWPREVDEIVRNEDRYRWLREVY